MKYTLKEEPPLMRAYEDATGERTIELRVTERDGQVVVDVSGLNIPVLKDGEVLIKNSETPLERTHPALRDYFAKNAYTNKGFRFDLRGDYWETELVILGHRFRMMMPVRAPHFMLEDLETGECESSGLRKDLKIKTKETWDGQICFITQHPWEDETVEQTRCIWFPLDTTLPKEVDMQVNEFFVRRKAERTRFMEKHMSKELVLKATPRDETNSMKPTRRPLTEAARPHQRPLTRGLASYLTEVLGLLQEDRSVELTRRASDPTKSDAENTMDSIRWEIEHLKEIEKEHAQVVREHADLIHFAELAKSLLTEEQLQDIEDKMEDIPEHESGQ